jgi:TRAP-type C4-dicarboxylate transport system substrate-binding protein
MKRFVWSQSVFAVLAVFILFSIVPVAQAQQKTITLNYSNILPPTHKISLAAEEWCKEIEKRTNGGVKITMFHGGTLTPSTQTWDGVVNGLSDLAVSVFSYHRGRFPLTEFSDLPLGIKNSIIAGKLFNEYYKKFKPKEMEEVKMMYLHGNPSSIVMTTRKQVTKLEDLKGLKLRVTPLGTPIAKALGAAPVAMPMGDAYDALSKNVVDGGLLPYESLEGWKLGEVVKYTTETWPVAFTSAWYVIMNKQKWNSIPPEWQKIIEQINVEWAEKVAKVWMKPMRRKGILHKTGRQSHNHIKSGR